MGSGSTIGQVDHEVGTAERKVQRSSERMVLTIASNAMKCPLFTQQDHEGYNDLATKDFAAVKAYWVKKYKAHKKYNRDQSATNEYESAAYTMEQPPSDVPTDVNTYVSALEEIIARQMGDREDALTINTTTTTPATSMASIVEEVTRLAALVSTMAAIKGGGGGRRRKQHGTDKDGNTLPKCHHCKKPTTHKATIASA